MTVERSWNSMSSAPSVRPSGRQPGALARRPACGQPPGGRNLLHEETLDGSTNLFRRCTEGLTALDLPLRSA